MRIKILSLLIMLMAFSLSACSNLSSQTSSNDQSFEEAEKTAQNNLYLAQDSEDLSNYNYLQGKEYAKQGRLELAKEHYTLALSASNSSTMIRKMNSELENINLMLKSLR